MNKLFPAIWVFLGLVAGHCLAGSATWNAAPVDNNWNNPANWTPPTVPIEPSDTATFDVSNTTNITITETDYPYTARYEAVSAMLLQ
jgi:hypothetical protein